MHFSSISLSIDPQRARLALKNPFFSKNPISRKPPPNSPSIRLSLSSLPFHSPTPDQLSIGQEFQFPLRLQIFAKILLSSIVDFPSDSFDHAAPPSVPFRRAPEHPHAAPPLASFR